MTALFENIKDELIERFSNVNYSLLIAVAWVTDSDIIDILIKKASEGKRIVLITNDDDINQKSLEQFRRLVSVKAEIRRFDLGTLMHHKYFIIDDKAVITGSYNLTYKASTSNRENILIISEANVISDYKKEFWNIYNLSQQFDIIPVMISDRVNGSYDYPRLTQVIKQNWNISKINVRYFNGAKETLIKYKSLRLLNDNLIILKIKHPNFEPSIVIDLLLAKDSFYFDYVDIRLHDKIETSHFPFEEAFLREENNSLIVETGKSFDSYEDAVSHLSLHSMTLPHGGETAILLIEFYRIYLYKYLAKKHGLNIEE